MIYTYVLSKLQNCLSCDGFTWMTSLQSKSDIFSLQVFVNFAKEQMDDDQLREVAVNGGCPAAQPSRPQRPTHLRLEKPNRPLSPTSASTDQAAHSRLTPEPRPAGSKTKKSRSNSPSVSRKQKQQIQMEPVGEATNGSKRAGHRTSRDPSALFVVKSKTQDSKMWRQTYWTVKIWAALWLLHVWCLFSLSYVNQMLLWKQSFKVWDF